jgi:rhodanese-related sulfurtransferase
VCGRNTPGASVGARRSFGRRGMEGRSDPGAHHVPLGRFTRARVIHTDRPLIVYCQGGARSAIAASFLVKLSFPRVANLQGGLPAWLASGYPVERGTPTQAVETS